MNTGKRQKVHLIHLTSAPGGLEVLLPLIIRSMPDYDFSVFVIRPPGKDIPQVYENMNHDIKYGSDNNFFAILRLWRYVIANRKAIFHVYNIGPVFLMVMRLAGAVKLVYSIHGTVFWKTSIKKNILKTIWKLAISRKYIFTANSNYSRQVFYETVSPIPSRIDVVYNPIKVFGAPMINRKRHEGIITIGYAGRLVEGKNLFRWLDIALAISKIFINTRFRLYGDGMLREELISYANKLGLSDRTFFAGYTRDIAGAYKECDLMLFLSERESFGNAIVESVLCGTPVIASDIPAFREILANWPQSIVSGGNKAETLIIEKIRQLDELKKAIPMMISEFRTRFSVEQHLNKLTLLYEILSA